MCKAKARAKSERNWTSDNEYEVPKNQNVVKKYDKFQELSGTKQIEVSSKSKKFNLKL